MLDILLALCPPALCNTTYIYNTDGHMPAATVDDFRHTEDASKELIVGPYHPLSLQY